MRDFRYPYLSTGYANSNHSNQTLNSKFYSNFSDACMEHDYCLDEDIILFPQRIPRIGFFEELYRIETSHFKNRFDEKIAYLKGQLKSITQVANLKRNEKIARHYINWASLCVRHGCFQEVVESSPITGSDRIFEVEIQTIKESAKIDLLLSNGLPVDISGYAELAKLYIPRYASERESIILLNQLIVTYYRHQTVRRKNKLVFAYAKDLLSLLEKYESDNIHNIMYCSIGYRGLAMVSDFGSDMQTELLKRAESLALSATSEHGRDNIVIQENQQICFQSIAKWHQQNGDHKRAELYLNKMIETDPFDSTGYSELGLLYLSQENHVDAAENFQAAMELGPPAAGMNSYYYATCLEKLGEHDAAIAFLLKATRLDDKAVSPYLDLFEIYKRRNDSMNAYVISQIIKGTTDLWEQLEDHEKKFLQTYAH